MKILLLIPDILFTIMRNLWLNQMRHAKLAARVVELDAEGEEHGQWPAHLNDDPHLVLLQKMQREQVRAAVERLPVSYREVILLRDFEGFSYQQIAAILCPAGTVMSRLGRARAVAGAVKRMARGRGGITHLRNKTVIRSFAQKRFSPSSRLADERNWPSDLSLAWQEK